MCVAGGIAVATTTRGPVTRVWVVGPLVVVVPVRAIWARDRVLHLPPQAGGACYPVTLGVTGRRTGWQVRALALTVPVPSARAVAVLVMHRWLAASRIRTV